jgi:hypothetical protein
VRVLARPRPAARRRRLAGGRARLPDARAAQHVPELAPHRLAAPAGERDARGDRGGRPASGRPARARDRGAPRSTRRSPSCPTTSALRSSRSTSSASPTPRPAGCSARRRRRSRAACTARAGASSRASTPDAGGRAPHRGGQADQSRRGKDQCRRGVLIRWTTCPTSRNQPDQDRAAADEQRIGRAAARRRGARAGGAAGADRRARRGAST